MDKIQLNGLKARVILEDQKAFEILYDYFYPKLFKVAKFFTKSSYASEEVLAEVFIQLWNNRRKLDKIPNLEGYLFIAVKRQSLRFGDRNRKYSNFDIDNLKNLYVEVNDPESSFLNEELVNHFINAVKNLSPKCRIVFRLVKDDGLKYKEVAELLNISEKTVELHMSKALKIIRNDLAEYFCSSHSYRKKIKVVSLLFLVLVLS
ncbi:MAG: RNA polymerase sigma-70 factor [Candidatus Cyclobacteriaceae bacterium M3_2C_046]